VEDGAPLACYVAALADDSHDTDTLRLHEAGAPRRGDRPPLTAAEVAIAGDDPLQWVQDVPAAAGSGTADDSARCLAVRRGVELACAPAGSWDIVAGTGASAGSSTTPAAPPLLAGSGGGGGSGIGRYRGRTGSSITALSLSLAPPTVAEVDASADLSVADALLAPAGGSSSDSGDGGGGRRLLEGFSARATPILFKYVRVGEVVALASFRGTLGGIDALDGFVIKVHTRSYHGAHVTALAFLTKLRNDIIMDVLGQPARNLRNIGTFIVNKFRPSVAAAPSALPAPPPATAPAVVVMSGIVRSSPATVAASTSMVLVLAAPAPAEPSPAGAAPAAAGAATTLVVAPPAVASASAAAVAAGAAILPAPTLPPPPPTHAPVALPSPASVAAAVASASMAAAAAAAVTGSSGSSSGGGAGSQQASPTSPAGAARQWRWKFKWSTKAAGTERADDPAWAGMDPIAAAAARRARGVGQQRALRPPSPPGDGIIGDVAGDE